MRILLLTTSFPLRAGASSGVFVGRLAEHLGKSCKLSVLAPADQELVDIPIGKSYTVSTFRYAPAKWRVLAQGGGGIPAALSANPVLWLLVPVFVFSMAFFCFKRSRHADLIFANWSICGFVAGFVGLVRGLPVVTTLRGEDANRIESSVVHWVLILSCLRLGQRVIAVSDDIANRVKKMFPTMADKVVMIPNGVDTMPGRGKTDVAKVQNAVFLVMVGSLIPRKSVPTVLHAVANLPDKFSLTIIGDGPEKEVLVRLAEQLKIDHRVNFLGHLPPEQVSTWLTKADVFITASRNEGRPNAVLEAMAAGLPIICSDIPGHRELVSAEVNGKFFPVDNVDVLVERILSFQDQALRQAFGGAAHDEIINRGLTWDNSAHKYMKQFEQLCSRGML